MKKPHEHRTQKTHTCAQCTKIFKSVHNVSNFCPRCAGTRRQRKYIEKRIAIRNLILSL